MSETINVNSNAKLLKGLDTIYQKAVHGIEFVSPSIEELAMDYLKNGDHPSVAARKMIKFQVAKCTTSGFITGLCGWITLPVSIPANISSVLYVQMRMIACAAYMAGLDVHSDQVQTLVYTCLAGISVNEVIKMVGVNFGEKLTISMIKRIPGAALVKVNKSVGFRFMTKFGTKGLVNFGKLVPFIGAVISGGLDLAETRVIGERAYKMFFVDLKSN
ncbi:MAG: EcsC family protein [Clostridia bacterium]|nr:EcsC family protein [Clostridia bacterium]